MKKIISTIMTVFLLAGTAAAQSSPQLTDVKPSLNPELKGTITRSILAPAHEISEAKQDLIYAYRALDVESVDDILTHYPQLVDTKIKDENGKAIHLIHYIYWPGEPNLSELAAAELRQIEAIDEEIEKIDRELVELSGQYKRVKAKYDRLQLNLVYGKSFCDWKDIRADISLRRLEKVESKYLGLDIAIKQAMKERKQLTNAKHKINEKIKEKVIDYKTPKVTQLKYEMIQVFYKHGAECEQCFRDSLKKGNLTLIEELNISTHIRKRGINYNDLIILDKWKDKWLPIAKEVVVESSTLDQFISETMNTQYLNDILAIVRSDDPKTQQKIEDYRELAYAQVFKGQEQDLSQGKGLEPIIFLEHTYQPTTIEEVNVFINQIEDIYRDEVKNNYFNHDESTSDELIKYRNQAIEQLKKVRQQLLQYGKVVQ